MADERVVITGIGVISPNGIGKDEFWHGLNEGESGIKPISLFDVSEQNSKQAGQISEFNPEDFLGKKGLRNLDRATKLVLSAVKLALDDAHFAVTQENTDDVGVAIGSTMGSLWSISEFDKEALKEGPRYVNPAVFPNTVINSPASQISIKFKIKGFNTTISNGFSASLDAIGYAVDFLKLGRAKAVICGGVEELCQQTFLGFYKIGFLSGSKGAGPEISCPFDRRRNGIVLGEGAAVFVLEKMESALEREADIYAEVAGCGFGFDAYRTNKYNPRGEGALNALSQALAEAKLSPLQIDCIFAGANSTRDGDLIETNVIKKIFGKHASQVPISAVKSMLGETFSAAGSLQVAAAINSINNGIIPPTINYKEPDPDCDLDYICGSARNKEISNAMVHCFGPSGTNTAIILGRV